MPAAPVLPPHHVGALISGRDSGRPCPKQAATPHPFPAILGRQVNKRQTWEHGAIDRLAGRGDCREMESRARARPAGNCRLARPGVECHSPEDWPQLFIATSQVPTGGSAHLYPRVGGLRKRSRSATTPPHQGAPSCTGVGLGNGLAIWIRIIRLQALASASSSEVQSGPQTNPGDVTDEA